jgi:acyl-CoA oxidase
MTLNKVSSADYLLFDDLLSKEEKELRYRVRNFMEKSVKPIINDYIERGDFPQHLVPKLLEIGVRGDMQIDKNYSTLSKAIVLMEMARVDASFSTWWQVHAGVTAGTIINCGSQEQKKRFLDAIGKYEVTGCFGLTEPDSGSDASNLKTTATRIKGGWLLNGEKKWNGNGNAENALMIIWAKNTQTDQVNGFLIDRRDRKRYKGHIEVNVMGNKVAIRALHSCHIILRDYFVPDEDRLPIDDFKSGPAKILTVSRLFISWVPIGIAIGTYEVALQYSRERKLFGAELAAFQLTQQKLVQLLSNIQCMFLLAYRGTQLLEKEKLTAGQSSLIKAQTTKLGRESVALARELLGANGIDRKYGVASHFIDMEATYTYEGTYDVNLLVTGREITKINAFYPSKL